MVEEGGGGEDGESAAVVVNQRRPVRRRRRSRGERQKTDVLYSKLQKLKMFYFKRITTSTVNYF